MKYYLATLGISIGGETNAIPRVFATSENDRQSDERIRIIYQSILGVRIVTCKTEELPDNTEDWRGVACDALHEAEGQIDRIDDWIGVKIAR